MMLKFKRLALTPFHAWVTFLCLTIGVGLIAGMMVFTRGLAVTNLTDLVPWGLWITIDLSSIALSAGAFMLCAAVYLLGLKDYQPLARTATYIGLTGYTMAVCTLMLDIGRPERFWHALVYWNPHSLLWEVSMCLTLYLFVLMMEVAPIVGQTPWMQAHLPKFTRMSTGFHNLAPALAVAGLVLSMLHQSSLGAAYGIIKSRPLWYSPSLSVLFIISAIVGGLALTNLITLLAGRLYKKVIIDDTLSQRLAAFTGWVLVIYLYFRFWYTFSMTYTYQPGRTEGLWVLTNGALSFNFWAGEILVGMVIPIVLLLVPRFREKPLLRMVALAMIVAGVIAYRWDINMAGLLTLLSYLPQEISARYTTYSPSVIEFLSGAGVVAFGALSITIGIRYLNIVNHEHHENIHW